MYIVRSHFLKFLHCIMFLLQLSAIALIAKMAAFTPEIIKAIAEVKVSDLELNNKKVQIFKILDEAGLSWFEDVHPDIILTHPKNRGTLMVHRMDVHVKGQKIVGAGADMSKLTQACAIQFSTDSAAKTAQLDANRRLIEASENMLAPLTGQERLLSLGNGHTVAWCRACNAGCETPFGELTSDGIHLSMEHMLAGKVNPKEDAFWKMCKVGWKWRILPAELEELFPDLPVLIAQSLNSEHNVQKASSEFEVAITIAQVLSMNVSMSLETAMQQATADQPACKHYVRAIGHWVKEYAGGQLFPLLEFLKSYRTKYAGDVICGEAFINAIAYTEFKMVTSTAPFTRCALMCTQLTSSKVEDGVAKMLGKGDVLQMSKHPRAEELECVIKSAWSVLIAGNLATAAGYDLFGKFSCRAICHILNKEKQSREPKGFVSLEDISQLYAQDIEMLLARGCKETAQSSTSEDKPVDLKSLEECVDPVAIYKRKHKLTIGDKYTKDDKVWTLKTITAETCAFEHKPVFQQFDDSLANELVDCKYADLKSWTKFKGTELAALPADIQLPIMGLANSTAEYNKACVYICLRNNHYCHGEDVICMNDGSIYTAADISPGHFQILPIGSIVVEKETDKKSTGKATTPALNVVTLACKHPPLLSYTVQPPACKIDWAKMTPANSSAISLFHWLMSKGASSSDNCNLEVKTLAIEVNPDHTLHVKYFTNPKAIKSFVRLHFAQDEPSAKKAKKTK
jgi:hypothetical protein